MRVYRIQDKSGRGPFRPGFSKQWADPEFSVGMQALPTWLEEFGSDLIDRKGRSGEFFGSAVETPAGLRKWFSISEMDRLAAWSYMAVSLRVDRLLAKSYNQVVFARSRPLSVGALIVPWGLVKGTKAA